MDNFSYFDLCVMATAIDYQRKLAREDYEERMKQLDRITEKIRQRLDDLSSDKAECLSERGFFDNNTQEVLTNE